LADRFAGGSAAKVVVAAPGARRVGHELQCRRGTRISEAADRFDPARTS
jgi:hypothetical protein